MWTSHQLLMDQVLAASIGVIIILTLTFFQSTVPGETDGALGLVVVLEMEEGGEKALSEELEELEELEE